MNKEIKKGITFEDIIYKSVDVYEGFSRWINENGVQREKNYNWFCPKCTWYNVDENKLVIVECENCGEKFKANSK